MTPCSREIKMLRPICAICEEQVGGVKFLAPNWFEDCPHDPYVGVRERRVTQPIYEPVDPEDPDGPKRITGMDTIVSTEPVPNWVSITHGGGVNKGRGVDRMLRRGYIFPQQLKSPIWPNGLKRRCQFRECYAEDLTKYVNGWFCRKEEAQLVMVSDNEETWEVGQFSTRSDKLQRGQLARQAVEAF